MKFPFFSVRTGIIGHLAILIISAMLLINVVTIKLVERDSIRAKAQLGRLLLQAIRQKVEYNFTSGNKTWSDMSADSRFRMDITQLLKAGEFSEALFIEEKGIKVFSTGRGKWEHEALSLSRRSLTTKKWALESYGRTWGVVWLAPENIKISAPVLLEGRLRGAITISAHLGPLYQALRKSENIILLYIFLNTIILVLFGMYLLSRTVVKPIHKLLRITKQFKDGEPFPLLVASSRNEIGQLFRSLNIMLKRLEENKKELKNHILSLENANKKIKKAQDEIIMSEKMASVGRLAAGIAHEIGNPIGITLGYLELLKTEDQTDEERKDFLDRIESEITRVNLIIRQLLDFSRPSIDEQRRTSIHGLFRETISIIEPQPMMSKVEIRTNFKATKDSVWAEPNQLKQVFLNIIINAADAMTADGSSDDNAGSGVLTIKSQNKADYIELKFIDTGPGISKKELGQIFDPFYTTKEPGKGTGLGLSVCYRIIEGLGGDIRAESTIDKGTTIIITIPIKGSRKNNFTFSHPILRSSSAAPQSPNPRNGTTIPVG